MDPLSAVGFASSILTFVEFSFKVISGTFEIVRSGNTAENAHVSVVINDLHRITKNLQQSSAAPDGSTHHDDGIDSLASECLSISKELLDLLQKLKMKAGDSKWKSINVSLRSMWAKGDVAYLEKRLDKCRSQMMMRLLLSLNDRQIAIMAQLRSQPEMGATSITQQLTTLQDTLINPFETKASDGLLRMMSEVQISINKLLSAPSGLTPEIVILRKLYFDSIYSREDDIENADSNTFRWIIEEEPVDISRERDYQYWQQKMRRREVREQFLAWLSGKGGIFHISGKAGSGKSTLMKLIFTDGRSRVELRRWAGDRKLTFARFFFWKGGDRLQRSFEGLQRSILFETLKQFPELIPSVFPDAYAGFSRANKAIDMEFKHFSHQNWTLAMDRLIAESKKLQHCLCLFIDGLDEFGDVDVDRLQHERLAEQLNIWASTSENVKILVSSRPYRAFHDVFPDQRRIRLHELTRHDIAQFSCNMFRKDKHFDKVKDCYERLVDRVVADADGVFLWARLAMRSLILASRRSSKLAYLEKHLDQTPKDLNDLYDRLLSSIGVIDRPMAFKMLLLVAEMEMRSLQLPAIALSWIDDMDDPAFPDIENFAEYQNDEAIERETMAEEWLDEYTKGLLEISTAGPPGLAGEDNTSRPIPRKVVQFFHRTVLDFVRESRILQSFAAENPSFFTPDTPGRLILAQMWFLRTWNRITLDMLEDQIVLRAVGKDRQVNFRKLERVIATKNRYMSYYMFPNWVWPLASNLNMSFLHWVAWRSDTPDYIRAEVSKSPDWLRSEDRLSFVVSAGFNTRTTAILEDLFALGASPNELVRLDSDVWPVNFTATAWVVFCVAYICHAVATDGNDYSEALEKFLATKLVDPDCVALVGDGEPQNKAEWTVPTRCISLRHLIQQTQPPNQDRLESLIDAAEPAGARKSEAQPEHIGLRREYDLAALLRKYPLFDISMQERSSRVVEQRDEGFRRTDINIFGRDFMRMHDESLIHTQRFYVHSVYWKTMRLDPRSMRFRLC